MSTTSPGVAGIGIWISRKRAAESLQVTVPVKPKLMSKTGSAVIRKWMLGAAGFASSDRSTLICDRSAVSDIVGPAPLPSQLNAVLDRS